MISHTAAVRWLVLDAVPDTAWQRWPAILDDGERRRADRFVNAADRQAFVAAHVLLRVMLFAAAGLAPADWRFVSGSHGKPALHPDHGMPGLEFNLSHTRGAVACGIARGCPIGVDIENAARTGDHLAIAESFFAPSEVAQLLAVADEARPALFVRLWTLKEAYIKACGQGLSMALDRFAFTLDPIAISFAGARADDPSSWQFDSIACGADYRLAVALASAKPVPLDRRAITHDVIEGLIAAAA